MGVLRHFLAACLVLVALGSAMAQDRPRVVAVNYPLQFLAERLLGDAAEVVFPVPEDVDPSFWRPTIADISMIQSADLILLNGAGFATWIDRVSLPRSKLVNTSAAVDDMFIVTESITHSHGDGGAHSHEGLASYLWLDPMLAIAQAEAVAAAITARDLAPAAEVEAAMDALRSDLEALDDQTRAALGDLQGVSMIATHPRYHYFARRYGLSVTALEWEAGAMPGDSDMADLRDLAEETGAQVLIWEAAPPAEAFEMTRGLGLRNVVFAPLAHGVAGQTYIDTLAGAVAAMEEALPR
ncbi:metal ABC transporter substrate-binding protein [Yoonia sp. R2331]|uniref:metal ABC transporter substrate-binding protein n=1 Tax=Yoonia sp. R2331 TaxID=3237238 RepID=UPI0034E576A0